MSSPPLISAIITTAVAPVAPEIIPGLPPKRAVTIPIIKAPYNPTIGDKPATKANATASGTNAIATVKPDKISSLGLNVKFLSACFIIGITYVKKRAKILFKKSIQELTFS